MYMRIKFLFLAIAIFGQVEGLGPLRAGSKTNKGLRILYQSMPIIFLNRSVDVDYVHTPYKQ